MNLRCAVSLALSLVACEARSHAASTAATAAVMQCKEPEATDERLAAGLRLYEQGDWRAALDQLQRWAKAPESGTDGAAGRGYYALAYALRMSGKPLEAAPWSAQARSVLESRAEREPSLEGFYYLSSIADGRQAPEEARSVAKRALTGSPCDSPDGDDLFRLARLNAYAGDPAEQARLMRLAAEALAAGRGRVEAYAPLAHATLAADLVASKKHAEALEHLREAARLDPSMPRIHRAVGLTMLRQGDVTGPLLYWEQHASPEVDGDDIGDAMRLLRAIAAARAAAGGAAPTEGLAALDRTVLDQHAREASAAWLGLSRSAGRSPDEDTARALAAAERRLLDVMLEYLQRGENLTRVAQANGVTQVLRGEAARTPRPRRHPGR